MALPSRTPKYLILKTIGLVVSDTQITQILYVYSGKYRVFADSWIGTL